MSTDGENPPTPTSEAESSTSAPKPPSSDVHFAFGPERWHWARFDRSWRFVRNKGSIWDNIGIHEPYWVAFKHDTGFFIGGEDEDGEGRVIHSWNDGYMIRSGDVDSFIKSRDAYKELHDWIGDLVGTDREKVKDMALTIGPKGSYFARCGSSYTTHALPKGLQSAIKESNSPPHRMALGMKGSWIVIWANGHCSWDLRGAYPQLASCGRLRSSHIAFAALSPFDDESFVLVHEDGACDYSHKLSYVAEDKGFNEMTDTYMRMRARRDGSTFGHSTTIHGVERQIWITPTSNAEEIRRDYLIARLRAKQGLVGFKNVAFVAAVTGGAGVIVRLAGYPLMRAAGLGTATGAGVVASIWFHSS